MGSRYLDILGLTSLSLSLSLTIMKLIILPITVTLLSSNPLSRILFPEDNEVEHSDQRCFNGEDYCEHPSSYPAAKIAKALQKEDSAFLRNMLTQASSRTTSEFRPSKKQEVGLSLR